MLLYFYTPDPAAGPPSPRYMKNERVMAYFGGQGLDMSDAASLKSWKLPRSLGGSKKWMHKKFGNPRHTSIRIQNWGFYFLDVPCGPGLRLADGCQLHWPQYQARGVKAGACSTYILQSASTSHKHPSKQGTSCALHPTSSL